MPNHDGELSEEKVCASEPAPESLAFVQSWLMQLDEYAHYEVVWQLKGSGARYRDSQGRVDVLCSKGCGGAPVSPDRKSVV